MADRLGECLEQAERGRFDDLAGDVVDAAVVDGLLEVVVDARGLEVQHQLDVDLERLRRHHLVVVDAVAALELHVAEDDQVAQRGSTSIDRLSARTNASYVRAVLRFLRTWRSTK